MEDVTGAARLRERVLMKENRMLAYRLKESESHLASTISRFERLKNKVGGQYRSSTASSSVYNRRAHLNSPRSLSESVFLSNSIEEDNEEISLNINKILLGSNALEENSIIQPESVSDVSTTMNFSSLLNTECDDYSNSMGQKLNFNARNPGNLATIDTHKLAGYDILLSRFLSSLGAFILYKESLPHSLGEAVASINFSNINLNDSNFYNVIEHIYLYIFHNL
jgi:hypothetical protein